jgi:hypothetical protein
LIPKKNRVTVYKYLFQEGVLWAKKDFNAPKHPDIESVPNLQVIKLMQSFKSRELVTERYAWCHYYWCAAHQLNTRLLCGYSQAQSAHHPPLPHKCRVGESSHSQPFLLGCVRQHPVASVDLALTERAPPPPHTHHTGTSRTRASSTCASTCACRRRSSRRR